MCGRYGHKELPQGIADDLGVEIVADPKGWLPGEAAPTTLQPVVGLKGLGFAHWGWRRDFTKAPLFNARSETLAQSRTWSTALEKRRCLVPAACWYEWNGPKAARKKWKMVLDQAPLMTFAGLWEMTANGPAFTIITRQARPEIGHVHERMPGIILAEQRDVWLEGDISTALEVVSDFSSKVGLSPVDS